MLSVVVKIYAGVLVDRFRIVTEGLMEDEQGGFRSGRGCVDQNLDPKTGEKKRRLDLEGYDWVNREAQWHVLRLYDVCGIANYVLSIISSYK